MSLRFHRRQHFLCLRLHIQRSYWSLHNRISVNRGDTSPRTPRPLYRSIPLPRLALPRLLRNYIHHECQSLSEGKYENERDNEPSGVQDVVILSWRQLLSFCLFRNIDLS